MEYPSKSYRPALLSLLACLLLLTTAPRLAADESYQLCGNGKVEGSEECDNGQNNSDLAPNACRTDCRLPFCGDDVTDNGEECDAGLNNSDQVPDACRRDCRQAHCGDGVVDPGAYPTEYCEDGNDNPYDGCHQCQICVPLKDDLALDESQVYSSAQGNVITICPGTYEFIDQGKEGIVQVSGSNLVINARDVTLIGKPREFNKAATAPRVNPALAKQQPSDTGTALLNKAALKLGRMSKSDRQDGKTDNETSPDPATPRPGMTTASAPYGTGFVVSGSNVVIQNSTLRGFRTAIKLQSTGSALYHNQLCENSSGIAAAQTNNFGVANSCRNSQNWQEDGHTGCSSSCN